MTQSIFPLIIILIIVLCVAVPLMLVRLEIFKKLPSIKKEYTENDRRCDEILSRKLIKERDAEIKRLDKSCEKLEAENKKKREALK